MRDSADHLGAKTLPFFGDQLSQTGDGGFGHIAGRAQLVEVHERDIQLANRSEHASQLSHRALERFAGTAAGNQGQRLADPPGRNPRLVDGLHVALLRTRKCPAQCGETLADDQLGRVGALHDGVTRLDLL
jgi:hypothetical protein